LDNIKVDNDIFPLQIVNAIGPNAQAASQNLKEIARTALDRVQETANEFRSSLHAVTQNQPAH
jgi:hypothetical protein